ncbi:Uu.00g075590.m01.CDS01 [Anthostomella pinea]|uniref:Uu.00g075590.m01.CDS01 n=1 Tax=Anthostomella pinea TaxID=933095 RepID=A0AAI8VVQ0_9PEZI|nr:Uu.00g075590.m01.CDS01 [Anthostomella pinea]
MSATSNPEMPTSGDGCKPCKICGNAPNVCKCQQGGLVGVETKGKVGMPEN